MLSFYYDSLALVGSAFFFRMQDKPQSLFCALAAECQCRCGEVSCWLVEFECAHMSFQLSGLTPWDKQRSQLFRPQVQIAGTENTVRRHCFSKSFQNLPAIKGQSNSKKAVS